MTTVLENMQLAETHHREIASKKSWAKSNAAEKVLYKAESEKSSRLEALKSEVADLCDLQPTPASMLRPPRKEMLANLKEQLSKALDDVETELDEMGGSVTTDARSVASAATTKTTATAKSAATSRSGKK